VIDHVSLPVTDAARSVAFYTAALAPLGYEVMLQGQGFAGLKCDGTPDFWISERGAGPSVHLAFRATSRAMVDAFHAAALAAGATDHGAPGLRPRYHPAYYAAFVLDPDGHNVEAVFHDF